MNTPDGWKLVPIEPTPEMINAAGMGWYVNAAELRKRLRIYRAMVDAAPVVPDQPAEKENEYA